MTIAMSEGRAAQRLYARHSLSVRCPAIHVWHRRWGEARVALDRPGSLGAVLVFLFEEK